MSDSVWPQRRQSTRLPCPWDSPGKNTGVGCHFLLQCMKVKRESEVAQSCPTLSDPMDCSLPGSSFHGICQARVLEWVAIAFSAMKLYIMTKPIYNSTNRVKCNLHVLTNTHLCCLFDDSHFDRCNSISLIWFAFHWWFVMLNNLSSILTLYHLYHLQIFSAIQ